MGKTAVIKKQVKIKKSYLLHPKFYHSTHSVVNIRSSTICAYDRKRQEGNFDSTFTTVARRLLIPKIRCVCCTVVGPCCCWSNSSSKVTHKNIVYGQVIGKPIIFGLQERELENKLDSA